MKNILPILVYILFFTLHKDVSKRLNESLLCSHDILKSNFSYIFRILNSKILRKVACYYLVTYFKNLSLLLLRFL